MQLKRLEISGFKSFADKCAIDFPPGISSIVGPNGCGKSNIIDAIKWVMGEQSVKQLRGKSMGDVIFAGTDKRPPLNMAEVSLIIAGHDGEAPGNISKYTEIMITRRLYRSGESQYLINRQPCRLKDISDIFLRYAMGSRSCAIIQQGNIGAITDASPEERRAFIEEAAGVMRYKSRKQEALSKVTATRENLTRLNDILEEIESRIAELQVEAEKARRYRDCCDRLKQADSMVTAYYHDQYTRKIESTEQLLAQLNQKTEYKTEEIDRLHAALQETASYRSEKDEKISQKLTEKEEKQRAFEKLEYELKHLKNEDTRITEENTRLERTLEELIEKNEQIETELTDERQKHENRQKRTDEIETEIYEENASVKKYKGQLSAHSRELDEKKERLMALSSQQARHQNIYQNAAANKETLERRMNRIEEEITQTGNDVSNLEETASETQNRLDKIKAHLDALLLQKSEYDASLQAKNATLSQKIKDVNQMENERSRYKSRLSILKKMESNFEWYKDGVKAIMKNHGEIDTNGRIMAVAAEVIEPAEGYEYAVEAAMEEALQYIIVDDPRAGVDYINFLRAENAGRSGFIPLDLPAPIDRSNQNHGADESQKTNDCAVPDTNPSSTQMLADCVHVRTEFEPIIKSLLAGIAVVETLNDAISLRQKGNRYRKIVTRQGDVLSDRGILVGGSRDKLAGILEKKHEIKQIQQDLDLTDERIAAEKSRQKELEAEVKGLENKLSDITQKKFKHEADHLDAEKTLYKTTERLKHAKRQMEIILLEKERIAGDKADIDSEMAHHDEVLSDISHTIDSEKSEIETITETIGELKETIKTYDNRLIDLKLEQTRLHAEMDNAKRALSRLQAFKAEGRDRIDEIRKNIAAGTKQKAEIKTKIESNESALAEIQACLKQLKQDLKDEQADYQSIVNRQQQTDKRMQQSRTELEKTREKIHKLELELSGLQINRENVVNRFLERYPDPFSTVLSEFQKIVTAPEFSIERTEAERVEIRTEIEAIGDVNIGAIDAYEQQQSRQAFLISQRSDLEDALTDLENVIKKINRITRKLFTQTFEAINSKFMALFPELFNGGAAWLELTRPDMPLETGVELMIQPPGKKLSRLSLLSGGEKALSAIAFIFSIFMLNPASFCLLDEIDAPLDDANVHRFNELLRIIGEQTQIIMISHKKQTMAFSDMLFGITIAKSGDSRMISVNIDQALEISKTQSAPNRENQQRNTAREIQ